MRVEFTPYSYGLILKALRMYYATLKEDSPERAKIEQMIDTISNIVRTAE